MAKNWYVVRVQSNKEDQVRESLERRLKADGLEEIITTVLVPSERISEIRGGQKRVRERKIYPGYIMVEIETGEEKKIADQAWFTIRETPGIGDFLGDGNKPIPMPQSDVDKILGQADSDANAPKIKIGFSGGEAVRIKEGPFENFEGTVEEVSATKGTVRVIVTIFGRPTPVELEYWQVERL
jgi:transcription termination/antitermination protein NusG